MTRLRSVTRFTTAQLRNATRRESLPALWNYYLGLAPPGSVRFIRPGTRRLMLCLAGTGKSLAKQKTHVKVPPDLPGGTRDMMEPDAARPGLRPCHFRTTPLATPSAGGP